MNRTYIGKNPDGSRLFLTPENREQSHMHVVGGTRTGKSKFLEWMIRQDILNTQGFCLIDWHGTLYHDVLQYCAHLGVGLKGDRRSVILLNPSQPDFISGFNPFRNPGEDLSTSVNRWIDAVVRPFGQTDTDQMPTFERTLRMLFRVMVEMDISLPAARHLLELEQRPLRDYVIGRIQDPYTRSQLEVLQRIKTQRELDEKVLSTENRFSRFVGSKGVERYIGLREGNIDLLDIMDNQKILLVNLGDSGFLDQKAARVFASLLVYEFKNAAMQRANRAQGSRQKPKLFNLYLDEFQEYITDDIGAILDQTLKGGLHMILAHQHLGHLTERPRLLKSILTNARIRAVFGGSDYEDATLFANEMFLPDLNSRKIKKAYFHTIHLYKKEFAAAVSEGESDTDSLSHSSGRGSGRSTGRGHVTGAGTGVHTGQVIGTPITEGWFDAGDPDYQTDSAGELASEFDSDSFQESETDFETEGDAEGESHTRSRSKTVFPVWVPIPVQELTSETEWTLEEKRSKIAEMLKCQMQQHCFIKIDRDPTQPMWVPTVKAPGYSGKYMLSYQEGVYRQQQALPAKDVDRILAENEKTFLDQALEVPKAQTFRRRVKPLDPDFEG